MPIRRHGHADTADHGTSPCSWRLVTCDGRPPHLG
ncbi:hypothetical protein ACFVVM_27440 [Nocardia sp. NPDC058176]